MKNKETYIFSKDSFFKFFVNNAEWIAISAIIIIPTIGLLSDEISNERAISGAVFVALVLFVIYFVFISIYKQFAYKIVFDFKNNKASFYMLRKQGVINVNLSDIEKVIINYRITFYLKNKRIKYHEDGINDKLIAFLDKNFEVESGLFRNLPFPFK